MNGNHYAGLLISDPAQLLEATMRGGRPANRTLYPNESYQLRWAFSKTAPS